MNIKSFILLVVALLAMTSIFADTEYRYELEIDYDFDEDEEIECEFDLGDRKKTETFDENDDRDDMSYDGRFDDSISVECNEKVDVDLRVLDLDDNEVEDIRETDVKDFYYELELFEAVIDFDYRFPNNVETLTCDLEIDEATEILTYSKSDDDSISETIEFEFLNELNFDCSENLDELRLRVEDPLGKDIYDLYLEEESEIGFDEETPRHKYDIFIFFTQDFDEDTDCDVDIDSDSDFTIEFEESSSGSERKVEYVFGESFSINCDENFEEALIDIQLLEDDNVKVFQADYRNTDSFIITQRNIDSYEEEKNQPEKVDEEKPEKVIIPEVVNPIIEEEVVEEISQTTNKDQNNNNINVEDNQTNSSLTLTNETDNEVEEENPKSSEPINIVYIFIGVVAIILLIAIIILVIKL